MNIIFVVLLLLSVLSPLRAQTLEDLVPDVADSSSVKINKAYQQYELDRIRSGTILFDRLTSTNPFSLTATLSFDSEYDIFAVIDKAEEYGLNVVGYHHHLGGSYSFSESSNPREEVQGYHQYMKRMIEAMISTFEPMANDKFLDKALRADAKRQLKGFESLESALNGDVPIQIIGVDLKGKGKILRKFVSENSKYARVKEVVLPGRRFGAISPLVE